jgi:hypothetical protein
MLMKPHIEASPVVFRGQKVTLPYDTQANRIPGGDTIIFQHSFQCVLCSNVVALHPVVEDRTSKLLQIPARSVVLMLSVTLLAIGLDSQP